MKIVSLETKENSFKCEFCDLKKNLEKELRQHRKKIFNEHDLNKTLKYD